MDKYKYKYKYEYLRYYLKLTIQLATHNLKTVKMLSSKRDAFHSQMRSKQVSSIIQKMRMQSTKQTRLQILESLIDKVSRCQSLSKEQMIVLFKWGLYGEENAVIFMGNCVIDGYADMGDIGAVEHIMENCGNGVYGTCEQYFWVLAIFYQRNHFKQRHLLHLANLIIQYVATARHSPQNKTICSKSLFYQYGLLLLRTIVKRHLPAAQLLLMDSTQNRNQKLLNSLDWICRSGFDNKIAQTCFSVMNFFAGFLTKQLCQTLYLKQQRILQLIKAGILRKQSKIRCLTYQIMTNLLQICNTQTQNVIISVMPSALLAWEQQKNSVKIQISYLICQCTKIMLPAVLKYLILAQNLLSFIVKIVKNLEQDQKIRQNFVASLIYLYQKRQQMNLKKQDLKAYFLFSQQIVELIKKNKE